jgi:hypothetical protein
MSAVKKGPQMKTALLATALVVGSGVVPAMADVWSRREDCIQLDQKHLEKDLLQYKSKEEAKYDWQVTVRTRYDAETGHCYVAIDGAANSGVTFTNLYDGQTGETLARTMIIWDRSNGGPVGEAKTFFGEIDDGGYIHDQPLQIQRRNQLHQSADDRKKIRS